MRDKIPDIASPVRATLAAKPNVESERTLATRAKSPMRSICLRVSQSIAFAVKSTGACANANSFCTTGRLRMHAIRDLPVAPTCRKVLVLRFTPNHEHHPRCPALAERGASRSSRTLSAGCDGRDSTSAQALRGRVMLSRTEKSCGPGIPTLMPSRRDVSPMTGARQPGPRGEREGNR